MKELKASIKMARGLPGKDGFSPTVDVTDIAGGHRVIICDAECSKSFDVMNGDANMPVPEQSDCDKFLGVEDGAYSLKKLPEETDPTVPDWAKQKRKPMYTADEVGALPATTKIPTKISDLDNDIGYLTDYAETDPTVPDWAKSETKPTYTANEVGADAVGTAYAEVSAHNVETQSHNDIRLLIDDLTTRLNALADSDDIDLDQLSEIIAYIQDNRELIDVVTTSKIGYSDIIDNLITNVSDKPLSASQGVNLKRLLDGKQPAGDYAEKGELPSLDGYATEEYVDNALCNIEIPESGTTDHSELNNRSVADQHPIEAITGLRSELDSKVASVKGKGLSSNDFTTEEKNKLAALSLTDSVATKYIGTIIGNGSDSAFTIEHNLGYQHVIVQIYDSGNNLTDAGVNCISENKLTVKFSAAPASGMTYTVVVLALGTPTDTNYIADYSKESRKMLESSEGHFWQIYTDEQYSMNLYTEKPDEGVKVWKQDTGSNFIKCPQNLCITFSDENARCYLYFYKYENGKFVEFWDIINQIGSASGNYVKNYLRSDSVLVNGETLSHRIVAIEDGVYMRFKAAVGSVKLYGWDGKGFGYPVSADTNSPTTAGSANTLHAAGSSGVTVPGDAKFILCRNGATILTVFGVSTDNVVSTTTIYSDKYRTFAVLPDGYDYFRVRLHVPMPDGGTITPTITGDISDYISVVSPWHSISKAAGRAKKVISNCEKICRLKWTAQSALIQDSSNSGRSFGEGVEYNGIPYGSGWDKARFVGWHISPHTFINAMNDEDSIIYNEKVTTHSGAEVLYYGIVCSAFASMCAGWPYPQTNAGFTYDPDVDMNFVAQPALGEIYSNGIDHCVIPQSIDGTDDEVLSVCAYEATAPLTLRTTRYDLIDSSNDKCGGYGLSRDIYDTYGYSVHHRKAGTMEENVPYSDFANISVTGGSARPYLGDKAVYTSEQDVLINIKDSTAEILHLVSLKMTETDGIVTFKDGGVQSIKINGASRINVKSYLGGDGFYAVYTDTSDTREFFEYHVVTDAYENPLVAYRYDEDKNELKLYKNSGTSENPVWELDNGTQDIWYFDFELCGNCLFSGAQNVSIPYSRNNDYRCWISDPTCVSTQMPLRAVFKKGKFGAYTVPCRRLTGEDLEL